MTTDVEAAETLGACHACGAEIPGNSGSASKYGIRQLPTGGIGYIYVCGPRCRSKAGAQAARPSCRECGQGFEHDYARGRRPDYCGRSCSSLAERRRARVWKAAAKRTLPGKQEIARDLLADVRKVHQEVSDGRMIERPPAAALSLLNTYTQELRRHVAQLGQAEAARTREQRRQELVKASAEERTESRAKLNDWLKSQGGGPVDEVPATIPYPTRIGSWPVKTSQAERDAELAGKEAALARAVQLAELQRGG